MLKNIFLKTIALVIPASSFQYIQNVFPSFLSYDGTYGPQATGEQLQYLRVKSRLRESIIAKEGYRKKAYLDSLGKLTVGIGHLVKPSENIALGQEISDAQIEKFWTQDSKIALDNAFLQAKELRKNPSDDFVLALTHVNYQLGIYWRSKFPNTWNELLKGNWQKAITNLNNSAWASQTPVRVSAFTNAIRQEYS